MPGGNTLCTRGGRYDDNTWAAREPRSSHRLAITTFFGTFTTAGFFPSYRTLLMIIIKDFLRVDPEFSARRDSARVRNADKIYRPRYISLPIGYTGKVFSLISLHFPSEDPETYPRKSLAHFKCPMTEIAAILRSVSNNFVIMQNTTSYYYLIIIYIFIIIII